MAEFNKAMSPEWCYWFDESRKHLPHPLTNLETVDQTTFQMFKEEGAVEEAEFMIDVLNGFTSGGTVEDYISQMKALVGYQVPINKPEQENLKSVEGAI